MRIFAIYFCANLIICSGCGVVESTASLFEKKHKPKSQLETRQMQTREYETKDTMMVMKAMLNILQDDGFIIRQANTDLGFFNATKTIDKEDTLAKVWGTFWWGPHATWKENSIIDCTANVSEFGEKTRVRINFQVKVMNNRGGCEEVHEIDDLKYYQEFFAKVDKGIFIEKEKI